MSVVFDPSMLINYGVLGVVLVWFMFRFEKIIGENTKAIQQLSLIVQKWAKDCPP